MPPRTRGADDPGFDEAIDLLTRARSFFEVRDLLDEHPIFRSSAFLAEFTRRHDRDDSAGSALAAIYEPYLLARHLREHVRWCSGAVAPSTAPGPTPPEPYVTVLRLVNDLTLPPRDRPFDSVSELGELSRFLAESTGEPVRLPSAAPSSARWNLGFVVCAGCGAQRAICRAHLLDLRDARSALRAGSFEDAACPRCGDPRSLPQWLLLCDRPRVSDPLAALCTVILAGAKTFVFRAPAGTVDEPETRQLIQRRMNLLPLRTDPGEPVPPMTSRIAAYSHAELIRVLDELAVPADPVPLPMRILVNEVAGRLHRQEIGYAQAEALVDRIGPEAASWPVVVADFARASGPMEELLVTALAAEKVARARNAPAEDLALLASLSALAYQALYQFAAAERTIARAYDLLRSADSSDELLEAVLDEQRAEIRTRLGHLEPAAPAPLIEFSADTTYEKLIADLVILQAQLKKGADAYLESRLADALEILPGLIETLDDRLAAFPDADDPSRRAYESSRCGAMGNLGGTLAEAATVLEEASAEASAALVPGLEILFPGGFTAASVRERALETLTAGMEAAVRNGSWDFAAIQGLTLARSLDKAGRESSAVALRAVAWAEQAGDYSVKELLHVHVASAALARNPPEDAVDELSCAASAWIRTTLASGHRQRRPKSGFVLGTLLVVAGRFGADAERTALILESMKAATTAATLGTGLPVGSEPTELRPRRESLRLRLLTAPQDLRTVNALLGVEWEWEQARAAARLRDPLFLDWVDDASLTLTDPGALRRDLAALGTNSRYLGFFQAENLVAGYLLGGEKASLIVRSRPELTGAQLATWLVAPFAKSLARLSPDDHLVISPDLTMPGLPFAAAAVAGRALAERATISHVQGTGMLAALIGKRRATYTRALAIGAPTRPGSPSLPFSAGEAANVAAAFPDGAALSGREATVPAVRAALGDVDVLHFACHSALRGAADPYARLLLAPDVDAGDSGELSEDRIATEFALAPGCFVNLAGCETAHQEERGDPLLGGLVPAFLVAGAGAVLASVSKLPDDPTSLFQSVFYAILARAGSPAKALALCQRMAVTGRLGRPLQHPGVWAGYALYGF